MFNLSCILTKLDRKQVINVLCQVCVFRANRKSKMAALSFDWLNHLSTSPPQQQNGFLRNLTGSKSLTFSFKFVFFVQIRNPRWLSWPLIGWNIFRLLFQNRWTDFDETWQQVLNVLNQVCVFSCWLEIQDGCPGCWLTETFLFCFSVTDKWILTKLDRSKILNVLYKVCLFRADPSSKMAAMAFDWLKHFQLLLRNHCMDFDETWQEARLYRPPPSLCFLCRSVIQEDHCIWLADDFFAVSIEWILTKLNRKQVFNVLFKICVFVPTRIQRWPPWPLIGWRIFWRLVCNHWLYFNETWQEGNPQRPLPVTVTSLFISKLTQKTRHVSIEYALFQHVQASKEAHGTQALWASCLIFYICQFTLSN